jgi:hypothetical protein
MVKKHDDLIPVSTGKDDSPGRVQIDQRGRNVWHWNDDQMDSTSILLKRLENTELELEPTRKVRAQKSAAPAGKDDLDYTATLGTGSDGGFDPYNRS